MVGDLNRDGVINGVDSQQWEQFASSANIKDDLNGDGIINATDRQILYANYGWHANQTPVTASVLPTVLTHTDLAKQISLTSVATDFESDGVFWRILGATHGIASLSSDGQHLLFTPDAGYAGMASVRLQADDGFASAAPFDLQINVSDAKLLAIHLASLPSLRVGEFTVIKAAVDFADEKNVAIDDAHYLTVTQSNLVSMGDVQASPISIDDSRDLIRAASTGPALIVINRLDRDGRNVQAAASLNIGAAAIAVDPNAVTDDSESDGESSGDSINVQPDVCPATLTLLPNGTRQLKVHLRDDAGAQTDISTAIQNANVIKVDAQGNPVSATTISGATRYISSDATVASVDANGLITAHAASSVTISIVHLETPVTVDYIAGTDAQGNVFYTPIYTQGKASIIGQSDISVSVQQAQLIDNDAQTPAPQSIAVNVNDGAVVSDTTGETVFIGAGALSAQSTSQDQSVSIARINVQDIAAAPGQGVLQVVGGFNLNVGAALANYPLQFVIRSDRVWRE